MTERNPTTHYIQENSCILEKMKALIHSTDQNLKDSPNKRGDRQMANGIVCSWNIKICLHLAYEEVYFVNNPCITTWAMGWYLLLASPNTFMASSFPSEDPSTRP